MAVWDQYMADYNNSAEHQNAVKWQNATINDVASKYGFNFSQDYANQQAEVAAQAKRNDQQAAQRTNQSANQLNTRYINDSLKEGVIGTERSAFQQYLDQRQQQANGGLNSGIQADQNLRLSMNAQQALAGFYRDAGRQRSEEQQRFTLENQRIAEALALIEQEKGAQAAKLYQDLLTQGYGLLGQERGWYNDLDTKKYGQTQDKLSNYYKEQELALAKARAAAQKAAQQAAAQQAAQKAANDKYNEYLKAKTAGKNTAADVYYANKSAQLNAGRSLARLPVEQTSVVQKYLPNTINPRTDTSLDPYTRGKIMFGY